jgi:hypothetical protein
MGALKQFTRKKNAFFRSIKFALINRRYRHKAARAPFNPHSVKHLLLLRLDDKIGDMVVTTGCARALAEKGYRVSVLTGRCVSNFWRARTIWKTFTSINRACRLRHYRPSGLMPLLILMM